MNGILHILFNEYIDSCTSSIAQKEMEDLLSTGGSFSIYIHIVLELKKYDLAVNFLDYNDYNELLKEMQTEVHSSRSSFLRGKVNVNYALNMQWRGKYAEAEKALLSELNTFKKLGNVREIAYIYHYLGQIYSKASRMAGARKVLKKSLNLRKGMKDNIGMASCYNTLAYTYERQNLLEKARELWEKAGFS